MAERAIEPELQKLYDQGIDVYSISKLNTINQCPYQAYLAYVLKAPRQTKIYGVLGGITHDAIEKCIKDGEDPGIIKASIKQELKNLDTLGVDFPLDRNGNPTIRNNWVANMTRFADEFSTPKGEYETEKFVLYEIEDGIWVQGYIDAIRHNKDGSIWIIDWKSSSQFDKQHLVEAGRQLIVYALAEEALGHKVKKVSWCMMKYCVTSWTLKNGKTKEKVSEWRNYIKDLNDVLAKKLAEAGYDDIDIDMMLDEAMTNNDMSNLPAEIQDQFKTSIYVRDYEITPELIDECKEYIRNSVTKYRECGTEAKNYKPCDIEKESYFCSNLCAYSKACGYYKEYLEKWSLTDDKKEEDEIF